MMLNKNEVLPQVELEMKAIFHKFFQKVKENFELIEWIRKNNVNLKIVRNIIEDLIKFKNVVKIGLISPRISFTYQSPLIFWMQTVKEKKMSWLLVIATNQIKRKDKNLDCAELLRFSLFIYLSIYIYPNICNI